MDESGLMAAITIFTALIVLGAFAYTLLHGLWHFIIELSGDKDYKFRGHHDPSIESVLLSQLPYYSRLPLNLRPAFTFRVKEFMENKDFHGREGLVVTDEMRILISAAAIQVTFGLKKFLFDSFRNIVIYPKAYFSRLNKKHHKGEVNLAGSIVFSWEDFKEGFSITDDNYNLGLHEMAHALRFDKFRNEDFDVFFNSYFDKWQSVGQNEFVRIKSGKASTIREYAGSNKEEFFAACVEYFFESPHEMKESHPDLYKHMCILLNQDPTKKMDQYGSVRESFFGNKAIDPGKLLLTSPLSYTRAIIPYLIVFALFSMGFISYLQENNAGSTSIIFFSIFISAYVMLGGFTISKHFKKFKVYENGLGIEYSLNPVLKNEFYSYDNIISITLREGSSYYEEYSIADTIEIAYTDGIIVKHSTFIIGRISAVSIEQMAAYLKYNNVLIKIFGKRWRHDAIEEIRRGLKERLDGRDNK